MTLTEDNTTNESVEDEPSAATSKPGRPMWHWLAAASAVVLVAVIAGGLFMWHARSSPGQIVGGAIVKNAPPAPDFALTDQFGGTTQLSSYKGRPVALTFLYTHCPDVCPLIAANLHETYKQLGDQAPQVGLVAVTVDPENDTVDVVKQYSDQRGLTDQWRFLVGDRSQVSPVWRAYGIAAQPDNPNAKPVSPAAQQQDRGLPASPDVVEHSAPIFLIDKHGVIRAMLPVDATPDTITTDLRVLLAES